MRISFRLPDIEPLLISKAASRDKAVIVSVIGKSEWNTSGLKIKSLGCTFPQDIPDTNIVIDGVYVEKDQIVYLHVKTLLDTDVFLQQYHCLTERYRNENKSDDFLTVYNEVKSTFAKTLLFLVHVSHIVIIANPDSIFDTSYIQYFKAVDNLSQKLFSTICDTLGTVDDLCLDWIHNGRLCTPRFLFYFDRIPSGVDNVKTLEHNLEDRIYSVLKKTRIISNSSSSLFAIPLNEEFVFISTEGPEDRLGKAVRNLIKNCQPGGAVHIDVPYSTESYPEHSFQKFLQIHIQQAKAKNFMETSSNRGVQTHFELPLLKHWADSTLALYKLLVEDTQLVSVMCTETRFSEQRCLKVLPLAIAQYQDGLSAHYSCAEHKQRLSDGLALFTMQAKGPFFDKYANKLTEECTKHWQDGRQQCEFLSLTGNPCKLPQHGESQDHKSAFVHKSVCDCGRKIAVREDPYSVEQANCLFYQQVAKECICSKLERITFPIHNHINGGRSSSNDEESLPEMLTVNSTGLLPIYSSWSLVCLGLSSLYSHNLGLPESNQPGFLNGTNYLLPWDVTVTVTKDGDWSYVTGRLPTNRNTKRNRGVPTPNVVVSVPSGGSQFSVKIFIGVEYECTSGHRFMLAGPDKMLKTSPGSIVKDTGQKVIESDMPLYFPCVCRTGKYAQLMRLHMVTPKTQVFCTLDPKVHSSSESPMFVGTLKGPMKLTQSAYWVLRLPYIYSIDKDNYGRNLTGKLLKGAFGVCPSDSDSFR